MIASFTQARTASTSLTTGVACSHCGLAVPAGLVDQRSGAQFCCAGCRSAHAIIHGCGLERYYLLRGAGAGEGAARATGKGFAEFDDAVFERLHVRGAPGGWKTADLFLEGIHCAACVWLIERLPRVVPGVIEARLDMRRALAAITWDPAQTRLSAAARALDSLGYTPHPARGERSRSARQAEERRRLVHLAVAGACAGNVMLLALALYAGLFDSMEPVYQTFFRWLSMGISLVSLAWPGSVFFRGAWAALRTGTAQLDLPIAVGLGAGAIFGAVNTVRGSGEIYFDSLSILVFALLLGRWVQHRQQRWTGDAIELLFSLTPTSARRVEGSGVREVPVEALSVGDTVEVLAGDSFPVDGTVTDGRSSVDQSLLTGESLPVAVGIGAQVAAGSVNLSGPLRVRVEAAGESTRVGRLMRMVEDAALRRAPIVRAADRIAGWFVLAMLALAGLTAAAWMLIDAPRALDNATALLIVTCPCALGLATPLAVTVAIGRAARRRILIKGGDAFERLARTGTIFLDKTGTITEGRFALVQWHGPEWVKPMVAAVEAQSSHPIARAMCTALPPPTAGAFDVVQTTGSGVRATVDGRRLLVGSMRFLEDAGAMIPGMIRLTAADVRAAALTPVLIAVDGEAVALAGLGDTIRPDSAAAVRALRACGWRVAMLSGDHEEVALAVGRTVGVDWFDIHGAMTPEGKLTAVQTAARQGPVVMVGDGVNDAGALAAATIGIAVHGGAEASLAAADIYLSTPGLWPIVSVIRAARRTMRAIRINLGVSLAYNALAAALAALGVINPWLAAILMPLSSLTVVGLSLKARTFGDEP
jgi:Cu2+-exporting ATPase